MQYLDDLLIEPLEEEKKFQLNEEIEKEISNKVAEAYKEFRNCKICSEAAENDRIICYEHWKWNALDERGEDMFKIIRKEFEFPRGKKLQKKITEMTKEEIKVEIDRAILTVKRRLQEEPKEKLHIEI